MKEEQSNDLIELLDSYKETDIQKIIDVVNNCIKEEDNFLENYNVPKDFINKIIKYIESCFKTDTLSDRKPLDILLYFIKNIDKLENDQSKRIEDLLVNIFKMTNTLSIDGINKNFLFSLITEYKNFNLKTIKEIYNNLHYTEHRLHFFLENFSYDNSKQQKEMLINLLLKEEFYVIKEVAHYNHNMDIEKSILIKIAGNNSRIINAIMSNSNLNVNLKYMIIKLIDSENIILPDLDVYSISLYRQWKKEYKIGKTTNKNENILADLMEESISEFIKPPKNVKSDTSLIQSTDTIEANNETISIKPDNFKLIEAMNKDEITYGIYPYKEPLFSENLVLELLYASKKLKYEKTKFTYFRYHEMMSSKIYIYKGNRYIRVKGSDMYIWYKFEPIKWKVNKENKSLDMIGDGFVFDSVYHSLEDLKEENPYAYENFINNILKKQILEPYHITSEEKELLAELEEKEKQKSISRKFEKMKQDDIDKKKKIEREKELVLKKILELQSLFDSIDNKELTINSNNKIKIPLELLIIKVNNHFEINPDYLSFLKYIDLSLVSTDNLKVNGIDWSQTNMRIDPQKVYNKDLSGCIFSDDNIVFKSLDGCNLCGTDLSSETESISSIGNAIIDENTKLPISLQSGTIIHK